jgi:16S rRNA (uracil1498-N3)-methyltransferase
MKPSRRLRRFFSSSPLPDSGERIRLSENETRHLRKILRLGLGDRCLLTDGCGKEAVAIIDSFSVGGESCLTIEELHVREQNPSHLTLNVCAAIPKRGKLDYLVEKFQEWGVNKLQPLETHRSSVKMTEAEKEKVVGRWKRIAQEAAKQSGSLRLTDLRQPLDLKSVLKDIPSSEQIVVFHPSGSALGFRDWVTELQALADGKPGKPEMALNLFFGPEGGFSEIEMKMFEDSGGSSVYLGSNILKVDTALLGVISTLRLIFE